MVIVGPPLTKVVLVRAAAKTTALVLIVRLPPARVTVGVPASDTPPVNVSAPVLVALPSVIAEPAPAIVRGIDSVRAVVVLLRSVPAVMTSGPVPRAALAPTATTPEE